MTIWLVLFLLILPFGFVLLFGAPYLPTRRVYADQALDLLKLKKGDVFVDLGCGDGTVLVAAAECGYVCFGYELNPLVWLVARVRTLKYGRQVRIYCRNFWNVPLPKNTQGVFVFLLDKYMHKLDEKLTAEIPSGARLVSYTFKISSKKTNGKHDPFYLYNY